MDIRRSLPAIVSNPPDFGLILHRIADKALKQKQNVRCVLRFCLRAPLWRSATILWEVASLPSYVVKNWQARDLGGSALRRQLFLKPTA
ncbi:MAG TPA: hypothetical protein VJB65_00380 [Patescibacteria group bacterium]|nr:hypothetical protein [Patescibacteria group bacterium]